MEFFFWIIAAAIAAAVGYPIILSAKRAAAAPDDAALELDARRARLEALEEAGAPEASKLEAQRALLSASEAAPAPAASSSPPWIGVAAALIVAIGGAALYLTAGRPGAPDQPHGDNAQKQASAPQKLWIQPWVVEASEPPRLGTAHLRLR
ncbi:MAG: c-type cytochrome biogenesis protein CcmI, partial [Pseudomonadota bacterium]